jgi:hypothetical protein
VFYPAALGENLLVFLLIIGDNRAAGIEEHKTAAGCARVDCANVFCHVYRSLSDRFPKAFISLSLTLS